MEHYIIKRNAVYFVTLYENSGAVKKRVQMTRDELTNVYDNIGLVLDSEETNCVNGAPLTTGAGSKNRNAERF